MKEINYPVWLKIANKIKNDIKNGVYKNKVKLPSLNSLTEQFKVNRNIIRQSLLYLQNIGLLSIEQGRGIFILNNKSCLNIKDNYCVLENRINLHQYDEKLISSELIIPNIKNDNIFYLKNRKKIWRVKSLILNNKKILALYSCEIQSNMLIYFKSANILTPMILENITKKNKNIFRPLSTIVSASFPEYELKHTLNLKHPIPLLITETNYVQLSSFFKNENVVLSFKRYFISNRVNIKVENGHILAINII